MSINFSDFKLTLIQFFSRFSDITLLAILTCLFQSVYDKLIEYSFQPANRIKLTFTIEVETYQPVFDPTTEMDANKL